MHTQPDDTPEAIPSEVIDQLELGWQYLDGTEVQKSYTKAAFWFQKSAEQGHPEAIIMMAYMFFRGVGVAQSNELAYYWAARAHTLGNDIGTSMLAEFHLHGVHVHPDREMAISLFQVAAAKGHAPSQHMLKTLKPKKPRKVPSSYDAVMDANLAILGGDVFGHVKKMALAQTMSKKKFAAANAASLAKILTPENFKH